MESARPGSYRACKSLRVPILGSHLLRRLHVQRSQFLMILCEYIPYYCRQKKALDAILNQPFVAVFIPKAEIQHLVSF